MGGDGNRIKDIEHHRGTRLNLHSTYIHIAVA